MELSYNIYEDKLSFVLPEEVEIIVDKNKINDYILWEKSKIDVLNQLVDNLLHSSVNKYILYVTIISKVIESH